MGVPCGSSGIASSAAPTITNQHLLGNLLAHKKAGPNHLCKGLSL
jgi:hypothetical protein